MIYKANAHDYPILEAFYYDSVSVGLEFFFLSRNRSCDSSQFE